mmetsp:Transcript_31220/g.37764  ORF Transcript_31220/g.37764 Transcript_31220/m.37764 type:complete len:86 (+) Transcript_31220:2-259(+)
MTEEEVEVERPLPSSPATGCAINVTSTTLLKETVASVVGLARDIKILSHSLTLGIPLLRCFNNQSYSLFVVFISVTSKCPTPAKA